MLTLLDRADELLSRSAALTARQAGPIPFATVEPDSAATIQRRLSLAERTAFLEMVALDEQDDRDEPEADPGSNDPHCVHEWNLTEGEADENNISGEGEQMIVCVKCGACGDV